MEEKISSGSEVIDNLLDGGYNKVVTIIYGPAASGKTTLAFLLIQKMDFQLRG